MNSSFKYSGVHWLGKIPSHWYIIALKRYASYISRGRSPDYTDDKYKGIPIINQACIYWDGLRLENIKLQDPNLLTGYRGKIYPGDLLVNSTGTGTLGRIGVFNLDGDYLADSHVTIVRPTKEVFAKYLYYILQTDVYQGYIYSVLATGATNQIELSREGLSNTPIIVPPSGLQKSIANFLDRKTAAIDTLIVKKQRLIQLLEEKRTALINQAVTKGLNPNAPMKDSGIPWIGEIPEHWDIVLLKRIAHVRYGLGQPPPEVKNGLPLIRATNIKSGSIFEQNMIYVDTNEVPKGRNATLVAGEIIVVRSGAYTGDSAIIPPKYEGAIAGYDMVVTIKKGLSQFIAWQLLSQQVRYFQFAINQLRAAQPHLNAEELNETILCFPPGEEQKKISLFLRVETDQIDTLVSKTKSSIEKLQEYRRSLITSAVTGKLEISKGEADV